MHADSRILLSKILPDASLLVMLTEPRACPKCKTVHFWFVNRDGSTLCVACDATRKRSGIQKERDAA